MGQCKGFFVLLALVGMAFGCRTVDSGLAGSDLIGTTETKACQEVIDGQKAVDTMAVASLMGVAISSYDLAEPLAVPLFSASFLKKLRQHPNEEFYKTVVAMNIGSDDGREMDIKDATRVSRSRVIDPKFKAAFSEELRKSLSNDDEFKSAIESVHNSIQTASMGTVRFEVTHMMAAELLNAAKRRNVPANLANRLAVIRAYFEVNKPNLAANANNAIAAAKAMFNEVSKTPADSRQENMQNAADHAGNMAAVAARSGNMEVAMSISGMAAEYCRGCEAYQNTGVFALLDDAVLRGDAEHGRETAAAVIQYFKNRRLNISSFENDLLGIDWAAASAAQQLAAIKTNLYEQQFIVRPGTVVR